MGLGAVFAAVLIGIFLSRSISGSILPHMIPDGDGAVFARGLAQSLLAPVLFGILLLVLTPLLRFIAIRLAPQTWEPWTDNQLYWGAGVGAVTALLFTLLWLSPLYSTLGAYAPVINTVASLGQTEGDADMAQLEAISDSIAAHPIVKASKSGPVSYVYGNVSRFSVNDASVSVPEILGTVDELMQKVEALEYADEEEAEEIVAEILVLAREDIIEQGWAYDVVQESLAEARRTVPELDENEQLVMDAVLGIFDTPRDVFNENCGAVLDLAIYALEHDLEDALESGAAETLRDSGFFREVGKLMNSSEQLVELKRLLLASGVARYYGNDAARAYAFLDRYGVGRCEASALWEQEGEALLIGMGVLPGDPDDAIRLHPELGENALQALANAAVE